MPKDAKAGDYSGTLMLKAEGWSAAVPLRLHVWDFALPEPNHLETAIGLSTKNIFRYHQLKTDADKRRVVDMYLQNFADHRVSPYDPTPLDPIRVKFLPEADPPRAEVDFAAFDAEMSRAWRSSASPTSGCRLRAWAAAPSSVAAEPKIGQFGPDTPQYQAMFASYVQQLESHLREKGWLKMAYIYWFDEPEPKDYAFARAGFERLKKYAQACRPCLPFSRKRFWRAQSTSGARITPKYKHDVAQQRRTKGERLWWYVCCAEAALLHPVHRPASNGLARVAVADVASADRRRAGVGIDLVDLSRRISR